MQHHRHSGVNEVVRILPCTVGRATLGARYLTLLISGEVERNPGPQIRGAQWNSGGLSQAKRVALERKLREDMVLFCLLQETRLASAERAALKKAYTSAWGRRGRLTGAGYRFWLETQWV
ncbi:hypothetical protein ERJ75_000394300 [Trypanosoma vivax]|nr:hypothetical protein ERJ75_000394300 [Trypanosoma vivax]